jgi:hypothetical protein
MASPAPFEIWLFTEANWNGDWRITGYRETSASHSSSYHRDFLSTHGGLGPHLQHSCCLPTTELTICPTSRCQQDVWAASFHLLTCSRVGTPDSWRSRSGPSIPISLSSMPKESSVDEFVCCHWGANSIPWSN